MVGIGRMDGGILATIWSLILRSLPRRHQAFEFFKPVEDDVDLGRSRFLHLDHHEPLAVGCDIVECRTPCASCINSLKEQPGSSCSESWFGRNVNGHHLVAAFVAVEQLSSVGCPARLNASIS